MTFLQWIGMAPTKRDKEFRSIFANSYKGVSVVGRGTVKVDPGEVRRSKAFLDARQKAKEIVGD